MKNGYLVLIALVLAAAPAWTADTSAQLDAQVTAVNRTARTPEGQQVVAQRLSQELGISAQTLQTQRQQTRLGWGEILIANRISQQTGVSFSKVVAEFRSGKGWGEIAREHNLNLGTLVRDVRASNTAMRSSLSASGGARGITTGGNRTEADANAGASAGAQGRGGDPGVTFGSGASGHASGGLGLGHGGGRR